MVPPNANLELHTVSFSAQELDDVRMTLREDEGWFRSALGTRLLMSELDVVRNQTVVYVSETKHRDSEGHRTALRGWKGSRRNLHRAKAGWTPARERIVALRGSAVSRSFASAPGTRAPWGSSFARARPAITVSGLPVTVARGPGGRAARPERR
jgi:hypothetical protein